MGSIPGSCHVFSSATINTDISDIVLRPLQVNHQFLVTRLRGISIYSDYNNIHRNYDIK